MTSFGRLERDLPFLLEELAAPRVPDYTDDLLARTGASRQRSEWAIPERWLPMAAFVGRLAPAPRIPWRLGVSIALLVAAALVAALVAGSLLHRGPLGPGRNGAILFANPAGQVLAGDPATGQSRVVLASTGNTRPLMAPDGRHFLVIKPDGSGYQDIYVSDLQGRAIKITPTPLTVWHYAGFSPTGDQIVIRDDGGRILLLDATRPAEPVSLSKDLDMGALWIGDSFNDRSSNAFRPPNGDETLFMAMDGRQLAAIRPDGTGVRTILDVQTSGIGIGLGAANWSPDGSRIALEARTALDAPWTTYIVNADGTNPRQVSDIGNQWSPMWSPDGKQLAFERQMPATDDPNADLVPRPFAVVDLATGALREVGTASADGYLSWDWSPDGKSILAVPKDGVGKITIIDVASGRTTVTGWSADNAITWERLDPN
jgi:Tol biopolymer transport system component